MTQHAVALSRREVLLGRFLGRRAQPSPPPAAPPPRVSLPILRPPGAVAEVDFLKRCTRCDACLHACPHQSIVRAPIRFRHAAGTPMIDAHEHPCMMCADTPCIQACGTGALAAALPRRIGSASIQQHHCLAYNRCFCSVCQERCPVPGAIVVDTGRPRVVADACTGCGQCHAACPAPINAIMILPAVDRPPAPEPA